MLESSGVVLHERERQSHHYLLSHTLQIMTQSPDADEILQSIVDLLQKYISLNCCFFAEKTELLEHQIKCVSKIADDRADSLEKKRTIASYYYSPILAGDCKLWQVLQLPSATPIVYSFADYSPISSLLLVPIFGRDKYYGSFVLHHQDSDYSWEQETIAEVNSIAIQCGILLDRQDLIEQNQRQQKIIHQLENKQKKADSETSKRKLFIDNLTHELRTPLTSVIGFSRYLLDEIFGQLNPKQKQYVNAIHESGQHLLEIVNDYLDLSKIDADRESLIIDKILIEDICKASLSMVEALAQKSNLELLLEIDDRSDFCFADSMRLKQILVNLLSNAIKFTETGSVTLKVDLKENSLDFSVIDTGIGIADRDKEKLFEPFQQLNNQINRYKKGSGLGLVLSRKLARLHGGDLTVTSVSGKGSCFTVNLPLTRES